MDSIKIRMDHFDIKVKRTKKSDKDKKNKEIHGGFSQKHMRLAEKAAGKKGSKAKGK